MYSFLLNFQSNKCYMLNSFMLHSFFSFFFCVLTYFYFGISATDVDSENMESIVAKNSILMMKFIVGKDLLRC